jgi:hypothetical protein
MPAIRTIDGTLWSCEQPGRWRCHQVIDPATGLPVDPAARDGDGFELEHRRSEPGAPAGWYLHGTLPSGTCIAGLRIGDDFTESLQVATDYLRTRLRH